MGYRENLIKLGYSKNNIRWDTNIKNKGYSSSGQYYDQDNNGKFDPYIDTYQGKQKTQYTIKSGDNLSLIAKNHNTDLNTLLKLNPQIKNPNSLNTNSMKLLLKCQNGNVLPLIIDPNSIKNNYSKSYDANNYFNSYLKSQGIRRILNNQKSWWEARHPFRKWYGNYDPSTKTQNPFGKIGKGILQQNIEYASTYNTPLYITDLPAETSTYYPKFNFGFIGTDNSSGEYPKYFVEGHEIAHSKYNLPSAKDSAQMEVLQQNTKTKKNRHDELWDEKHSDLWGLRYLLYKEGIYDSRKNKNITPIQVLQLKKKYPKLRPFQQMNINQIVFQLNHVASSKNNTWKTDDNQTIS